MPTQVLWRPSHHSVSSSTLAAFVDYLNSVHDAQLPLGDYTLLHKWSVTNLSRFWHAVSIFTNFLPSSNCPPVENVIVNRPTFSLPSLVNVSWFVGASLNFTQILLRNAQSRATRTAIVYYPESAIDGIGFRRYISFAELEQRVHNLALALRAFGLRRGDSVAAVLAHTPDAVVAMLATAALGCVWSCCSPDFGHTAICDRFVQTKPKVLFYTPWYRYKGKIYNACAKIVNVVSQLDVVQLVLRVPGACPMPEDSACALVQIQNVTHVNLRQFEISHEVDDHFEYEMITMDDPVLTMFSSGTTGRPKCIVQGCGVLLNQLKEHVLHHEVTERSCMLYNTSTGWMLFNWQLAALATGCCLVLYDGAALPDDNVYRLIDIAKREKVTHFGSGAKYYHALKKVTTQRSYDFSTGGLPDVRMVMATGSPSTTEHFVFASQFFGSHVQYVSMSGGTEINGCFALGTPWKPVVAPELQCAGLGMDVQVYNENGESVIDQSGELVCCNVCPCMPLHFAHDDDHQRYKNAYFNMYPGVWSHGDFAIRRMSGGFLITGRSDSTLNPGGVRIGTSDIYQVVEALQFVESALVTERSTATDTKVIMFIVTKDGIKLDYEKERNIRHNLRSLLSPRHVPHFIIQIPQIPVTFSGKKCEVPVKRMLQGIEADNREAIQNPEAFDSIRRALQPLGLVSRGYVSKTSLRSSKM